MGGCALDGVSLRSLEGDVSASGIEFGCAFGCGWDVGYFASFGFTVGGDLVLDSFSDVEGSVKVEVDGLVGVGSAWFEVTHSESVLVLKIHAGDIVALDVDSTWVSVIELKGFGGGRVVGGAVVV